MERIGLIDIGSNTIRLVIFEFDTKTGLNELLNIKNPSAIKPIFNR
ncbi:exopolyphosphatase [Staphylococcus gallinarum]|uniref:Exopolyphosphatase n=1 Tax=Staphylococcus gallinarum TaxID=1293 RepID=A0A380FKP8_STAGA|nr:exopolyphosphatase [Staphylococcus gallinarum]